MELDSGSGSANALNGFELYQVIPVTNPAVDANCTVTASPASVTADGVNTSTVTVTLNDSGPAPVAYKTVTLARNGGTGAGTPTITTLSGMTNASGVATFSVKCTTVGDYEFQATDVTDGNLVITQKAAVTFTTVPTVDIGTSTVSASPTSVSADGVTTSTVTVTLLSSASVPVAGKAVTLARNGNTGAGTPTVTTLSGTTNLSGEATFTVKCTTAGLYDFEATDTTDSLTVSTKATVTFTAAPAHAGNSTVIASPTSVTANGSSSSTITVTLKDLGSNAVPGKTVTLASSRGATDTISAASGLSNSSGVVTFTVTSTTLTLGTAATFTATVTDDSVILTQKPTVNFVAPPPSAADSTVVASPVSVPADGTTTSTVTVTLLLGTTPIEYKTVTLAKTSGPGTATITTVSGRTNASGVATFTVKCTAANAGVYVFTATDTSDSVVVTQTATVTFVVPPLVANAGADAYITGTSVQIGGSPTATGGLPNYTYLWSPSEGLSATNVANPTATAAGTYTLTLTDSATPTPTQVTDTVVVTLGANPNLVSVDFKQGTGTTCVGETTLTGTTMKNAVGNIFTGQSGSWNALNIGSYNTNSAITGLLNTGTGAATTVKLALGSATGQSNAGGWRCNPNENSPGGVDKLRLENAHLYNPTLTGDHYTWAVTGLTPNAHYRLTLFGNGTDTFTNIANTVAGVPDTEGDWNWTDIQASATGVILGNLVSPANNRTYGIYGMQIEGTLPSLTALVANAGTDQTYTDTPVAIGGSPTASGGAGSGYTYSWSPSTGLSSATAANPTAAPATTTTYTVTVNDGVSTAATDSVIVTVGSATPPYQLWADANAGGQAANLDYNNDGVQNGIAYFMGMNGLAANPGVVAGKVTWPRVGVVDSFEVQVSTNLTDWAPAPSGVDTSDPTKVVYTLPTGAAKTFCRLSVIP